MRTSLIRSQYLGDLLVALIAAFASLDSYALKLRRDTRNLDVRGLAQFRRAVALLKDWPAAETMSWIYQANIHGKDCRHRNPLFSAWHRGYVYYMERLLADALGESEFTIPYWDWSTQRKLPPAFEGTEANPLFHKGRVANGELAINTVGPAVIARILATTDFGAFTSQLEDWSHNFVHAWVGGDMNSEGDAGKDPVFFVHHSNIDRLWESWLRADPAHKKQLEKYAAQKFKFIDETGKPVEITVGELLDLEGKLKYGYVPSEKPDPSDPPEPPALADAREILVPISHSDAGAKGAPRESFVLELVTSEVRTEEIPLATLFLVSTRGARPRELSWLLHAFRIGSARRASRARSRHYLLYAKLRRHRGFKRGSRQFPGA